MTERAAASARRVTLDKVGILIGILTIVAVFGLSFAVLRPNRIAAGTGLSVVAALPAMQGAALSALGTGGALWAMTAARPSRLSPSTRAWFRTIECSSAAALSCSVG